MIQIEVSYRVLSDILFLDDHLLCKEKKSPHLNLKSIKSSDGATLSVFLWHLCEMNWQNRY